MACFLTRTQLARLTSVLGHYYRSSLGLFSTTPQRKIPAFGNPNKYMKRGTRNTARYNNLPMKWSSSPANPPPGAGSVMFMCWVPLIVLQYAIISYDSSCAIPLVCVRSCREVQAVMSYLKPEVIFLELCKARSSTLQPIKLENICSVTDIAKAVMGKRTSIYDAIHQWNCIKGIKKFKNKTSEFCVAYEEAKKYGSEVVLGDRLIEVTSNRAWRKMSLWQKTYTMWYAYFSVTIDGTIEWEVTLDERDKYMAHKLLEVARKNSSVVAIVGRAHLIGIKKYWKQPIKVEDLMTVPPPSNSYLQWLGVAVVGVATIILVIYFLV